MPECSIRASMHCSEARTRKRNATLASKFAKMILSTDADADRYAWQSLRRARMSACALRLATNSSADVAGVPRLARKRRAEVRAVALVMRADGQIRGQWTKKVGY